jgi:hypothetical protein
MLPQAGAKRQRSDIKLITERWQSSAARNHNKRETPGLLIASTPASAEFLETLMLVLETPNTSLAPCFRASVMRIPRKKMPAISGGHLALAKVLLLGLLHQHALGNKRVIGLKEQDPRTIHGIKDHVQGITRYNQRSRAASIGVCRVV